MAVALALAAVSNSKADGALFSPRAQGNQAEIAAPPGTNATVISVNKIEANPGAMLSPRAQGNQIVKTAGTNKDPNLAVAYIYTIVPPHALAPQCAPRYEIAPVK